MSLVLGKPQNQRLSETYYLHLTHVRKVTNYTQVQTNVLNHPTRQDVPRTKNSTLKVNVPTKNKNKNKS